MTSSIATPTISPRASLTHIKRAAQRDDPLMNFRWVMIYMPDVGGTPLGGSAQDVLPQVRGVDMLNYVEAIDLQFVNLNIGEGVYTGTSFDFFAGPHGCSSFSITFYEDVKAKALYYCSVWKASIKDINQGKFFLPGTDNKSGYKKVMRVQLVDNQGDAVLQADLQGIWPADTSNFSLSYQGSDRINVTQTFSIDNIALHFMKQDSQWIFGSAG